MSLKTSLFILFAFLAAVAVQSADRFKFRTCPETDFCRRLRASADPSLNPLLEKAELQLAEDTLWDWNSESSTLSGKLQSRRRPLQAPLQLRLRVLRDGILRFSVREEDPLHRRLELDDLLLETESLGSFPAEEIEVLDTEDGVRLSFFPNRNKEATEHITLEITNSPFLLLQTIGGTEILQLNSRDLLKMEQFRTPEEAAEGDDQAKFPKLREEEWKEQFGGFDYNNPKGPSAISLDVQFSGAAAVYGIPEHATNFALKPTIGVGENSYDEPYRLYNLDTFEYEQDVPMALYGSVPFMMSHSAKTGISTGFLWLNAAETFVDVSPTTERGVETQWMSETGVLDAFLIPGPSSYAVWKRYARLTGFQQLPPKWSIAHHQCRWNYKTQEESLGVDSHYDRFDIPYDTLWLDIEHTDGKRYFTWDKTMFPEPKTLQATLAGKGRHLVTIVDPHIKRDPEWSLNQLLNEKDLFVKNAKDEVYEGSCWPGTSGYPDFLLPEMRDFWASRFSYANYPESTSNLFIWNDMNEPSVFSGPEGTMDKDAKHLRGTVEHREVHNLYGYFVQQATAEGLIARDAIQRRPFVLTRAFFAGSQKYGAVWTGDNTARWEDLAASVPMLLSLNIAGIHFSGADVGGFFGHPDPEMMTRWYQVAAFQPFFRNHAHIDTPMREPWVFGEPWTGLLRSAIRQRYRYLPYIYTQFWISHTEGAPIMRPLWAEFPTSEEVLKEEKLFLVGPSLLIAPVTQAGQDKVSAFLPGEGGRGWFDLRNGESYPGGKHLDIPAELQHGVPLLQRAGSIIPTRERARRSSVIQDAVRDPFTLTVALDEKTGTAEGLLYQDDGETFAYREKSQFSAQRFTAEFRDGVLTLTSEPFVENSGDYSSFVKVERIAVQNTPGLSEITKCRAEVDGSTKDLDVLHIQNRFTIRKPELLADGIWKIVCE